MTPDAWFDTTFCARLTLTLGHFLWQGLVIACLAMCVGRLLRGVSTAARYRVFVVAFLLMAACPPMTFCLIESTRSTSAVDLADTTPSSTDAERNAYSSRVDMRQELIETNMVSVGESTSATASAMSSGGQSLMARRFDWRSYAWLATAVYLGGTLVMLVRLAMGVYGGGRLRRRSSPLDDPELITVIARHARSLGLRFSPAVAYCQQIAIPTVIGVLRPTILLPLSVASGLNEEQLEAILAHELAHIRRYDFLVNLIQRLIEALLFFHPAVWLVSRRIRIERERCCDDLVLAAGAEPLSYASSLLKVAELGQALQGRVPAEPVVAVGATGQPSDLANRIRRLVEGRSGEPVRLRHPWASLSCAAVVFAVGSFLILHLNVQARSAGDAADELATTQDHAETEGGAETQAGNADATIKRLLSQLRDEDWYLREAAALELGKMGDKALVDPFTETLKDERTEVRRAAARGLGDIGDVRAVQPLIAVLEKAEEKFEIEAIVRALSQIGDPAAIGPIVTAIRRAEPRVDLYSVRSIVRFQDPRVADLLLDKMRNDSGGFNFNVVAMLVQLKERRLLEPLLEFLATSNSRKRWRAADALGHFGDPRAVEPLIAVLGGNDRNVREAAAESLGELGDAKAVEPLVELLKKEKEDDVLQRAAVALGMLGDQRALASLESLANHDDGRVRDAARRAIADIELGANRALRADEEDQAIELAASAMKDGNEVPVWAAARALRRIGSPRGVEVLVCWVKDPRSSVRSAVIDALAWIESDGAADGLARALTDEDTDNRWKAATTLARRKDRRAIETLVAFGQNGNDSQKYYAAEYLCDLGDPRGVLSLCAMLNDSDRSVRVEAARALCSGARAQALDSLLKALKTEEDDNARRFLVLALGQIYDPRAIQALVDVLADNEHMVRANAARGLARLGWKPSTDIQRIRFMMASGRVREAGGLIPKAEATGDKNHLAGKFELNKPILTPLTVGTGEWPSVLMLRSVEFRKQADGLVAIVQMSKFSWPTSSWRVSLKLKDDANKVMATGEMTVKTSGVIISVRALEPMRPHELNIGRVDNLAHARRFELSVDQVPDDRQPPSPVEITAHAEGPLALAKDIPVKLEAKNPGGQEVVWAQTIRFDQTADDEKKKELKATLRLRWASLRKADWRVWVVLLDGEGKMVTRSSARFSTERIIKGLPKVEDESLDIPLDVWKGGKNPVRFRVGLELTKDHTKTVPAQP